MKAGLCSLSLLAGEGGIIELWERRTDSGLGFGFVFLFYYYFF